MQQENTSFDIHKYIKLLLRRKWLWIIPTILFSIGSIIYAVILPDVYESKCVLIVERSKVLNNLLSENERGIDARKLLQAVRERMLGWQSVIQVIKIVELDKDIPQNDLGALEKLYYSVLGNTTLKTKGQNLIEVSYRGENPEINFRIVDGLVSNFMEHSLKSARIEADETVEFVEDDLKRLKRNLDVSERQLREFEEEHLEELPGSQNSKLSRLARDEKELAEIDREIMVSNEKISFLDEHMEKEDKTITGEVVQIPNPKVNDLNKQINNLEIELTSLRAKFFDEHPGILMRMETLARLKEMLERESEKIVSEEKIVSNPMYESLAEKRFVAQLQLKTLQRRGKEIESSIIVLRELVKNMPSLKQELAKLKRDYDVNKQLYGQRLLQKSKAELMREMSLDAKTNPFNIVEPARISYEPIKAIKIKIISMGVILGMGIGVGLIFGLEQIDQRFKTVDEVQEYLKIPALGMIPTILTETDIRRKVKKRIILSGSLATFIIVTTTVCLVVEPVKTIVSDKANVGWDKLVELVRK